MIVAPELIVVVPVKLLLPRRIRVPVPCWVMPAVPVPEITPE